MGFSNFIDSLYICFIQEHWLIRDHLYNINEISSDFVCVSVSGVDSESVLLGRPYGGCSILDRKSLSPFLMPLDTYSDRFCAVKLLSSCGLSIVMICVYMPNNSSQHSSESFSHILGEIEGFIDST